MTPKPLYEPMSLSPEALARTAITLPLVGMNEPVPTIHVLARTALSIHRTRRQISALCTLIAARTDWVPQSADWVPQSADSYLVHTSRIELGRTLPRNREGEEYSEHGVPDLRPLRSPVDNLVRPADVWAGPAYPDQLPALYEGLAIDLSSAVDLGDRLDAIVRDQLPVLSDHPQWHAITAGSGSNNGWTLHSLTERVLSIDVVRF